MEGKLAANKNDKDVLRTAKRLGFADKKVAELWNMTQEEIYAFRKENGHYSSVQNG